MNNVCIITKPPKYLSVSSTEKPSDGIHFPTGVLDPLRQLVSNC